MPPDTAATECVYCESNEHTGSEHVKFFLGLSDRPAAVWTLTTWLTGDPPEGFGYGYASQESAERNGRMFACAKGAQKWQVVSPAGVVVASWERSVGTPSEMGWVR